MSDRISTKAGVFESGEKDVYGVQYKDGRLIACRNPKLKDYAVAEGTEVICDRAFMNMKELRSVILPASLRAIGESAFSGCKALADISLPDGVTEIRQATFRDCDSLAAIELPASVTEIEKFAFGRGLTTLVVNAPEMKIDKYAFMNARDLATLIVPAGRAGYYRALLADMRVKADVEETQESVETENNKTKIVTVEVSGYEKWLEPKDEDDEECYDAVSRFAENGLTFTVDGEEYISDDFADADDIFSREQLKDYEAFDAAKFFAESGAEQGMLYINKAGTTIDIEIPKEDSFDPKKAALVLRDFIYPDDTDEPTVCAFIYDGIFYDCNPEDSRGISREQIWPTRSVEIEVFGTEKWLDDGATGSSLFSLDAGSIPLQFTIEGKSYGISDFGKEQNLVSLKISSKYKDLDVVEFFTAFRSQEVLLWTQKAWSDLTIDIPAGENFDPSKAAIISRYYIYPDRSKEAVMMAFVYNGKIYECNPEDSNGGSAVVIWRNPSPIIEDCDEGTEDSEDDRRDELTHLNNMSKKVKVTISATVGSKELRCGDYMDFYIAPISAVQLAVEDEDGNTIYEDEEYELCPTYSIDGYSEALENPEEEENQDCIEDYKDTTFKAADFFKKVWDKMPMSEADFCRCLVKEATDEDTVEMELSLGEDEDQPLVVTFEIELPDGEFDIDKLSFINFDMDEGAMGCADIIDQAFTGCDKVLLNLLKYGDTFYQNCGDDGFVDGCYIEKSATVDRTSLQEC